MRSHRGHGGKQWLEAWCLVPLLLEQAVDPFRSKLLTHLEPRFLHFQNKEIVIPKSKESAESTDLTLRKHSLASVVINGN